MFYLSVTGNIPQGGVVDVRGDDFLEPALPVFLLDHVDETIVNDSSVGKEESAPGTQLVEEEQILILKEKER